MLIKKVKILLSSLLVCTSLIIGVSSFNTTSVHATNNTIAYVTQNFNVQVAPTDINNIRSCFNNYVAITRSPGTAYSMSKLLIDTLPEVSYINFKVTDTTASVLIHKKNLDNIHVGDAVVGIDYNYKENYVTYKFQNLSGFSTNASSKILDDVFISTSQINKVLMLNNINNSITNMSTYVSNNKTSISQTLLSNTESYIMTNNYNTSYGNCAYGITSSNDGKLFLQIALVQR